MGLNFSILKRNKDSNKIRRPKYKPNSYSHLRESTKKRRGRPKKKELTFLKRISLKRKLQILGFLFLATAIPFIYYVFYGSDIFLVKNINVDAEDFDISTFIVTRYQNTNILKFHKDGVVDAIKQNFDYVETVYVKKEYPDTLYVEVINQVPVGVALDPTDLYYLDESYKVLNQFDSDTITKFQEFEVDILMGIVDLNIPLVRDRYRNTLETEEEKENYKWEEVTDEEKVEIIVPIMRDVDTKYFELQDRLSKKINKVDYEAEFYVAYLEETDVSIDNSFNTRGKTDFAREISDILIESNIDYMIPVWLSPTTLRVDLVDGNKIMYFTTERRSSERLYEDQLRDLQAVINNNKLIEGKVFDFRTKNYAIIR